MNASVSKTTLWISRVLSALVAALLVMSAAMKIFPPANFAEGMAHLGWPMEKRIFLAVIELSCVALYLIPRTAVLGAILVAAYMGGATATHVRVDDPYWTQPLVGVVAWLALWLREPRLRALLPLRS
jgi:uncharacterized membrane protein YphA (DoxX/SURF4 family)